MMENSLGKLQEANYGSNVQLLNNEEESKNFTIRGNSIDHDSLLQPIIMDNATVAGSRNAPSILSANNLNSEAITENQKISQHATIEAAGSTIIGPDSDLHQASMLPQINFKKSYGQIEEMPGMQDDDEEEK